VKVNMLDLAGLELHREERAADIVRDRLFSSGALLILNGSIAHI
jgi:hypothetical protein